MTHSHGLSSAEFAEEAPPGAAGQMFGILPESPFEHTPERLVLSSEEHSHLIGGRALSELGGAFHSERFGHGDLSLVETGSPGEVHIQANIFGPAGPAVHMDARVRESWLVRAASGADPHQVSARIVGELFQLAAIPRQSTVKLRVDAD